MKRRPEDDPFVHPEDRPGIKIAEAGRRSPLLPSPGRPRAFDDAAEQRMRENFREQALREAKHYGRLPGAEAKTTVALVRQFADAEGVKATDRTLRRRVVDPVLRELKNKA
jgi:hypothetical protein